MKIQNLLILLLCLGLVLVVMYHDLCLLFHHPHHCHVFLICVLNDILQVNCFNKHKNKNKNRNKNYTLIQFKPLATCAPNVQGCAAILRLKHIQLGCYNVFITLYTSTYVPKSSSSSNFESLVMNANIISVFSIFSIKL